MIMAQTDVDGDGRLSRSEFMSAMLEWNKLKMEDVRSASLASLMMEAGTVHLTPL